MPAKAPQPEHSPAETPLADRATTDLRGKDLLLLLVYGVSAVPLFFFLLGFLSRWMFVAELVVNFQVQWFTGLLVCGLALLLLRRWLAAGIFLLAAGCCFGSILPIYFSGTASPGVSDHPAVRIMSYNVLGSNRRHQDVLGEIRLHNPDILIVAEYTLEWAEQLKPLKADYPYAIEQPRWHGFGIALFSKLPLEAPGVLSDIPLESDAPMVRGTIRLADRPLEIIGLHLLSPTNADRLRLRDEQFDALGRLLAKVPTERVVLGDFNCTTWSDDMREFLQTTGLRDSRQGFGLQPSWSPPGLEILSIPIDHALVSPGLAVVSRKTGAKQGSDHCPVIVELTWDVLKEGSGR